MTFLITGLLFILGILLKKSKCIYFLQFWWMWVLMSFCEDYYRADYQNYMARYLRSGTGEFTITNSEFGYTILNKVLYNTGIDFNAANACMVLMILLIIAYSIPKYTKYITIPSSMYMIYPLFMNGIQIRNAIVSAIIIFGFQYLLKPDRIATIKYVVCVAVAVTFHSAAIIYLLLILIKYIDEKKIQKFTIIIVFSIMSLISIAEPILSLLFGAQRFAAKIYIKNSIGQMFMMAFWQFSFYVILLLMRRRREKGISELTEFRNKYEDMVIKTNLLMLVVMPIYYADFSIERLFQNLIVLGYIYLAIFIESSDEIKKRHSVKLASALFMSWFVTTTIILEVWYADNWNNMIMRYMNNNTFISNVSDNLVMILFVTVIVLFLAVLDIKRVSIRNSSTRIHL